MRAQEYFEGIRETVVEIERSKEMLERLKASEGAKVQRYGEQQGNGNSDAMDRVNRRIEFEQRLQRRINSGAANFRGLGSSILTKRALRN